MSDTQLWTETLGLICDHKKEKSDAIETKILTFYMIYYKLTVFDSRRQTISR
jgi:hypothetical protein